MSDDDPTRVDAGDKGVLLAPRFGATLGTQYDVCFKFKLSDSRIGPLWASQRNFFLRGRFRICFENSDNDNTNSAGSKSLLQIESRNPRVD